MKKFLIVIGILVVIIVLLGLFAPKDYTVARSINMKASKEVVYEQISLLKNFNSWSPWAELDSAMVTTYEGTDGTVGAKSHWEGNKDVGKGTMELKLLTPNEKVETTVHFIEPWESISESFYSIAENGDSLTVTWSFSGHNAFPSNIFGLFMNMDDMLGTDFNKGLNKLKIKCESTISEDKTYNSYKIIEFDYQGGEFIAVKKQLKMEEMSAFFQQSAGQVMGYMQKNNIGINGTVTGLYYSWDEEKQESESAFAVPFLSTKELKLDKGLEVIKLNPSKAIKIEYYGAYEKSANAHYAMDEYMKEKGIDHVPPVVEEYITDPTTEADTTKWLTNIIYLIQ